MFSMFSFISQPVCWCGLWPCMQCRILPTQVQSLQRKLDSVLSQNASLTQLVTQQQIALNTLQNIERKFTAFRNKLFSDDDDTSDDEDDEPEEAVPEGTLLIGDSLIQDVVTNDESMTIDCIRGATLTDIKKRLKKINPKKRRYNSLIIVAGTNDASSKRPIDKIVADYRSVIEVAKKVSASITVSSIPPRTDKKVEDHKLENINELLVPIMNEKGVRFSNNDVNFRYRDNTIDTSLLKMDGLHLAIPGVKKLLLNLNLEDLAKVQDTRPPTKPQQTVLKTVSPASSNSAQEQFHLASKNNTKNCDFLSDRPVYFKGEKSPLSNFYQFSFKIWNMSFPSAEHAFQYHKCVTMGNNSAAAEVRQAPSPLEAKRAGDRVTPTPRWHDLKQGAAYEIVKAKSRQCLPFYKALKDSQERLLIENTFDPYWGKGSDGKGLNMLGRLLMTLRAELCTTTTKQMNFTPAPSVRAPRNEMGSSIPRSPSQQLRCFNCGERSHTIDTCRHRHPLQCYNCHGNGHKKKYCPQNDRNYF